MPMFGGDSTKSSNEDQHQSRGHKDHSSDAVIDPALRSLPSSPSSDKKRQENDSSLVNHHQSSSDHPSSMPIHLEQFQMSSPFVSEALSTDTRLFNVSTFDRRRHHFDTNSSHRLPSPPPITTMSTNSHSPSPSVVSVDRSSNSTPHIRRSPPQHSMQPPAMYSTSYQHDPPMIQSARHHSNHQYAPRAEVISHPGGAYLYSPHPPFEQHPRYEHQHHDPRQAPYPSPSALSAHYAPPPMSQQHMSDYNRQYPIPGQPPVTIVHTDDAATKLTDGIRRRCFNCCTTDTSTWRRSNLSPGKVLCNKCGLFERTHSRPRPDQFPHKRGPLAASALRGRTPPGQAAASNQLPPISGAAPYQYHHQSITPLNAGEYHSNTLPGLQAWHGNTSGSSSNSSNGPTNGNSVASNGSNNHAVTGPGVGGGGESNNNGSISGSGTQSRRSTLESPRLQSSQSSSPRGRPFDEQLSSNSADPSSHPPSPPSTISRSSTTNNTTGGGGGSVQESSSASHTPSPAGSAREPPA